MQSRRYPKNFRNFATNDLRQSYIETRCSQTRTKRNSKRDSRRFTRAHGNAIDTLERLRMYIDKAIQSYKMLLSLRNIKLIRAFAHCNVILLIISY